MKSEWKVVYQDLDNKAVWVRENEEGDLLIGEFFTDEHSGHSRRIKFVRPAMSKEEVKDVLTEVVGKAL